MKSLLVNGNFDVIKTVSNSCIHELRFGFHRFGNLMKRENHFERKSNKRFEHHWSISLPVLHESRDAFIITSEFHQARFNKAMIEIPSKIVTMLP